MDANEIREFLKEKLVTYEDGVEFFGRLGYADAADAPVPTREWADSVKRYHLHPIYMAQLGDFKIIYCELPGDRILRTVQRAVIEQLARSHAFFMVVFHNRGSGQNTWDFANVRVTQDEQTGRVRRDVRHITVGESERQQNRLFTASHRLAEVDVNERQDISLLGLQQLHKDAFDVEQVTNDFYKQYVEVFDEFAKDIARLNPSYAQDADAQAQALLDRLMFLYFIQHKGWLNQEYDYLYSRFETYDADADEPEYFQQVIVPLFLRLAIRDFQSNTSEYAPFLNGGLFQFDTQHMVVHLRVSNRAFNFAFINLFEHYAFTVEEDMPDDRTVAIDPEMLGKVFETLILNREQDKDLRKSTGSYYTPRTIVSFMCQQSLREYVVQAWRDSYHASSPDGQLPVKMEGKGGQGELRDFELDQDESAYGEKILRFVEDGDAAVFSIDEARYVRVMLLSVRIIDPAVGSGAFLVGMLQEIIRLITLLDEHTQYQDTTAANYAYILKRDIIGKCLYGVDIQEEAVQICELRLWLSLVVDYEPQNSSEPFSQWIREVAPLPNLSYLVRRGNSLIEQVLGETVQFDTPQTAYDTGQTAPIIDVIQELKSIYYRATDPTEKTRIDKEILSKQAELTRQLLKIQQDEVNRQYEKKYKLALPGMEKTLSRGEQYEKDELFARIEHLRQLGDRASDIRRRADALHVVDENVLRQLRNQLGAFIWRVDFGEVFAENGGFDIAIANPPYIRQEKIKSYKVDLQVLFPEVFSGTADLFAYFYAQALRLLRFGGVLTFISSNKFLLANYGRQLRLHLKKHTTIQMLIDFGDLPVFDATTYPFILSALRLIPTEDSQLRILQVTSMDVIETLSDAARIAGLMKQSSLRDEGWHLVDSQMREINRKIDSQSIALREYVHGQAYYGIKTGLTKAFVISDAQRVELIRQDQRSAEIIKPFVRGRDIERWRVRSSRSFIILAKIGIEIENYPAIYRHLMQYKSQLEKRDDFKPSAMRWYHLRPCDYYEVFEGPKILYQRFQVKPAFVLDTEGHFTNDAVWLLSVEDYFLLGYLNSRLGWYEISRHCTPIQNGYQLIWSYFQNVRVPAPSERVATLVKQLLQSTRRTEISRIEQQLDEMFYSMYGFTEQEIAVIEDKLGMQPVEHDLDFKTIREAYDENWLVVEVTAFDNKTGLPERGVVRYKTVDDDKAYRKANQLKQDDLEAKTFYVFFNEKNL